MYSESELKAFSKMGVEPPIQNKHLTDDQISAQMNKLLPDSWRLEGNQLKGMTSMGELVLFIPTNYVCTGTDHKGLPKLEKVVV